MIPERKGDALGHPLLYYYALRLTYKLYILKFKLTYTRETGIIKP